MFTIRGNHKGFNPLGSGMGNGRKMKRSTRFFWSISFNPLGSGMGNGSGNHKAVGAGMLIVSIRLAAAWGMEDIVL